ncbi:TetR/AcrR family transcriptional regulator [soil metagenome]
MAQATDGRQARWAKHNQQRRLTILAAAVDVLEAEPVGADVHVHQIAAKAGLNRTVVYRHFTDRADLDTAIRHHIIDDLTGVLTPAVNLDGSVNEVIRRIISTYVDWTVSHPALHAFAVLGGDGPFQHGTDQIAQQLTELLELAIALLGAELDESERALVDPLAHGLVGAVFGTVRRWVTREPMEPSAYRLSELLTMSVWNLLDGHARRLGLEIDPDLPLTALFASADVAADVPAEGSAGEATT